MLRLTFQPEEADYAEATQEYRAVWAREGQRITEALVARSGLQFVYHQHLDILEKIVARQSADDVATYYRSPTITDSGHPLVSYGWDGIYVVESFVNALESVVLSDRIGVVFRPGSGLSDPPDYWSLVDAAPDVFDVVEPEASLDTGVLDLAIWEPLDSGEYDDSFPMWSRAYNGQFRHLDEGVVVRLPESDWDGYKGAIAYAAEAAGGEERPDDSGVVTSPAIYEAYRLLQEEYATQVEGTFQNLSELVLPPLATAYLARLSKRPTTEEMVEKLLLLRSELQPVREKFSRFQAIDSLNLSIEEAENIQRAIQADAERLAGEWNTAFTSRAWVGFCLDNVSFLVRWVLNPTGVKAHDLAYLSKRSRSPPCWSDTSGPVPLR